MMQTIVQNLEGVHYILVEALNFGLTDKTKKEYLIKMAYVDSKEISEEANYIPENGGHIDYELVKNSKGDVKLKWGALYTN